MLIKSSPATFGSKLGIYLIAAEGRCVALKPQIPQPRHHIHAVIRGSETRQPLGDDRTHFSKGIVNSVSSVSTTNTARSFAGCVLLALALTLWRSPGSSEKLSPAL